MQLCGISPGQVELHTSLRQNDHYANENSELLYFTFGWLGVTTHLFHVNFFMAIITAKG